MREKIMPVITQCLFFILLTLDVLESLESDQTSSLLPMKEDNCIYGPWSEWSGCSITCGFGGERNRYRTVSMKNDLSEDYHFNCEQAVKESKPCGGAPCPNDCLLSDWSDWGPCNCQINQTERTRSVVRHAKKGGRPCPSELRQVTACDSNETCVQDCELSEWSDWSTCSATCGQGISLRQRSVVVAPINEGVACSALLEAVSCDVESCHRGQGDNICFNISGNLPDPARVCSKYYISCLHDKKTWRVCPVGLIYLARNDTCDYPQNVPECSRVEAISNKGPSHGPSINPAILFAVFFLTSFVS